MVFIYLKYSLILNPKERPSADELLNFKFITTHSAKLLNENLPSNILNWIKDVSIDEK
jgi:hypothetical protein